MSHASPPTSSGGAAPPPPPVVRRGRGTFKHQLRTEEMERQTAAAYGRAEEASTIVTAATATVVLPSSTLGSKTAKPITEEEEIAAQFAHLKKGKDIPLNSIPVMPVAAASSLLAPPSDATSTRERLIAAAIAAAEARANAPRTHFGLFEHNQNDTARQLLFRGEKRRRYCVIIGDLQNQTRQVTLKLFGHKGAKPFKLQNKLIRLVNLSIGKPRRGTLQWLAAHGILDPEEQEAYQRANQDRHSDGEASEKRDASDDDEAPEVESVNQGDENEVADGDDVDNGDSLEPAEQRARQQETHAAAGFDVDERVPSSASSAAGDDEGNNDGTVAEAPVRSASQQQQHAQQAATASAAAASAAAAADAVPLPDSDSDEDVLVEDLAKVTAAVLEAESPKAPTPPPALSAQVLTNSAASPAHHVDPSAAAAAASSSSAALPSHGTPGAGDLRSPHHPFSKGTEAEGEDVDHYLDEDEVVPLTVQQAGPSTSVIYENSLANSPVLTARRFSSLHDYFLKEFRFLLNLEDVRAQNVSVKINLGAAYCCLARQGSYSTPLKHATFGEFVERMNTESMQLYFIKDCPTCVSRAVDMESGSLNFPASSTTVKIIFFSNERQSRSIARAVWDSDEDQFRLLDVENVGIAFNWSVFSLDETFVRRKGEVGANGGDSTSATAPSGNPSAAPTPMAKPAPALPTYRSPAAGAAARARMGPAPVGIGMDIDTDLFQRDPAPMPMDGAPAALGEREFATTEEQRSSEAAAALAPPAPISPGANDPSVEAAAASSSPKAAAAALLDDDDEDDLARNKTVAYPFEVEFRAFRRWKQQGDNPAAPLAKAILEELSLAEHNFLSHGSSAAYERMDLTNVCEVDFAAEDLNVESIVVEHTSRVKPEGTDLLVDNTTSLFIENFAAARQLKEKVSQYGPRKVINMQNASNNNYMRALCAARRAEGRGGGRDAMRLSHEEELEVLKPTSKLTFFRSRGSSIHWKLRPNCSLEENIAPMTEALSFLQQVLHTANDIERTSARGGAAPDAL